MPTVAFDIPAPIKDAEIKAIRQALIATDNNVTSAAHLLRIGRSTLYKKINKF